ncbi:hexosaminidase [Motilibacter rhizosphaerae]|uniref:beta-N-acetylhexosaminidase n=1 Tax=Motilibacter rhizosphaerae TaxID=598652 RepID=A0A4Q7NAQ4_9ACTN|nr:family 20 glycosylhydrolase [Motilibacter rhizosphaerae]RZS80018.1 hexosaminidase [Motilibacter rhizosphaerae]
MTTLPLVPLPRTVVETGTPLPLTPGEPRLALPEGWDRAGAYAVELLAGRSVALTVELADLVGEAHELRTGPEGIEVRAGAEVGAFRALTTLAQLLDVAGDALPGVEVADEPRFPHRGVMLDVARHWLSPDEVCRFVDLAAAYKLDVLHLHLTDDQGWRLPVPEWPALAEVGGRGAVGGDPARAYAPEELARIVQHAADRFVTVVPETDMPGHTNAALAACPELNPDGVAPAPRTDTEVGYSSLDVRSETTWAFVRDVLAAAAAAFPGAPLHIGGDETLETPHDDYVAFVARASGAVTALGRRLVVWEEAAAAVLPPGSLVQVWHRGTEGARAAQAAVAQGCGLVLSPADRTYLDLKYDEGFPLGLTWAGTLPLRQAYDWDPVTLLDGVDPAAVEGVEAALWSETLRTLADVETMALPRLLATAEVGWSAQERRDWAGFRERVAACSPGWTRRGRHWHPADGVDWPAAPPRPPGLPGGTGPATGRLPA